MQIEGGKLHDSPALVGRPVSNLNARVYLQQCTALSTEGSRNIGLHFFSIKTP